MAILLQPPPPPLPLTVACRHYMEGETRTSDVMGPVQVEPGRETATRLHNQAAAASFSPSIGSNGVTTLPIVDAV